MAYSNKKTTDRLIKKLQNQLSKTPSNLTNRKNHIKRQISKLRTEERTRESKRAHAAPKPVKVVGSGKTASDSTAGTYRTRPGATRAPMKRQVSTRPSPWDKAKKHPIPGRSPQPKPVKKPSEAGTTAALAKIQGKRSITEGLVIKNPKHRAKKHVTNPLKKVPSRRRKETQLKPVPSRRRKPAPKKKPSESNLKPVPSRRRKKAEEKVTPGKGKWKNLKVVPSRRRKPAPKKKPAKKKSYWSTSPVRSRRRKR